MHYFIDNIKNNIDFFLRSKIIFSRKNYSEKDESKDNLFKTNEQKTHLEYLHNKYDLSILSKGEKQTFLENLYCLDTLDKYLSVHDVKQVNILDIGSKSWNYAKSEYLFFNHYSKNIFLNGIELDAFRMCTNFYTRFEISKYHIKNLKNTQYIAGDFLLHNQKYDYIIWFLPFVTEYPLIKWGLPLRYLQPLNMLKHAYNSLKPNGELLIINQGENEYNIQKTLNESLNSDVQYFGEISDIFNVYKQKRFCCKITKKQ